MLSFGIEYGARLAIAVRQGDVGVGVGAALLGRHDDGARELREELAALALSAAPFLCLIDDHLEWPDIVPPASPLRRRPTHALEEAPCSASRRSARDGRTSRARCPARRRRARPSSSREDVDALADALDPRRADEDAVAAARSSPLELERRPRSVQLAAVAVAPHDDVDHARAALVGQAVDWPRAASRIMPAQVPSSGPAVRVQRRGSAPRGRTRPAACRSSSTRRRGATRPSQALQLLGRAHLDRVGAERRERRDVLAERALQREDADAGVLTSRALASRLVARRACRVSMPTIGVAEPLETLASSLPRRGSAWSASTIARARGAGSSLLKMPEPTKHAVGAELHHQRRVGGRRDAAGGEHDDRQAAELGAWP